MITWFLVGWTIWNIIGLISALGNVVFWGFMWLLWVAAPSNKYDHLCSGPWSTPPPLPPRINGQTKVSGRVAVGVIVGILLLVAVPTLVLVARNCDGHSTVGSNPGPWYVPAVWSRT